MSVTKIITQRLTDTGITKTELAKLMGISKQNLWNKFDRDNFTTQELERICTLLDMKLIAHGNDGKQYKIEY